MLRQGSQAQRWELARSFTGTTRGLAVVKPQLQVLTRCPSESLCSVSMSPVPRTGVSGVTRNPFAFGFSPLSWLTWENSGAR